VAASRSYDDWLIDRLKDPKEAAAYLEAAIEDSDQGVLMLALRHVALARGGVAEIARRSQLTREATYRMLSASGNPELKSLTALLAAAGLRLSVKPMGAARQTRTPRKLAEATRQRYEPLGGVELSLPAREPIRPPPKPGK
jgi:probable addiction module antidote protein